MVALPLLILRYTWPYLLCMFVLGGAYLWADTGWCNHVCRVQRDQAQKLSAEKAEAQKRATDLALLWDQKRQAAENAIQERDREREQRQMDAIAAAKRLDAAVAAVRVPAPAVRLLNDAIGNSAPEPAPKPAESTAAAPQGADSTVGLLTQWGVTVIGMYDACRDEVIAWQKFYADLQSAQPKERP